MPPYKRSRLSWRLLELIPFDWIEADKIIEQLTPEVPPGMALRRYERDYTSERKKVSEPVFPPQKLDGNDAIRVGARSVINEKIVNLRREGYVESQGGRGKNRQVRQVKRLMYDGKFCCLHGGSCGGDKETPAIQQPEEDDPEVLWNW